MKKLILFTIITICFNTLHAQWQKTNEPYGLPIIACSFALAN